MFVGLRNVLLLSVCLIFAMGQAQAVALGKIEVTSHLGETFFAEAPIQLESGEKVTDLSVDLASASDYQILEVFRDSALNKLTVEVVNDLRGPRAVIRSSEAVDTPYFNLVIKLRHGHATNFKKYPVFLDLPEQVRPSAAEPVVAPVEVEAVSQVQMPVEPPVSSAIDIQPIQAVPADESDNRPQDVAVDENAEPTGSEFNPYEGWARTSRYGPMVHGDTLSTVARRLPVDQRYTANQIMVGLYNKNKDKFREGNINLINAGTYLNVPSAADIESIPDREAKSIIKDHEQRWKQLKDQPVYAAEAEAQSNRYRTRVHVGQAASGTAAAPVQAEQSRTDNAKQNQQQMDLATGSEGAAQGTDQLRALQEENLRLKQALQESEATAVSAPTASADAAAADAQAKKLELTVARLQRQLQQVNQELQEVRSQDMNSLTYALGAIILLLIAVAGYLLFLLRRERPHPAMGATSAQSAVEQMEEPLLAPAVAAGVAGAVAAEQIITEEAMDAESFASALDNDLQEDIPSAADSDDALLFETKAPSAQPGVDYLAEAEVYLRYGMEDEALQQMHLAIEQNPNHLDAHVKIVQFLQARGDESATNAAIEAARSALDGDKLQTFEDGLTSKAVDSAAKDSDEVLSTYGSVDSGIDADMDFSMGDFAAVAQSDDATESDGDTDSGDPTTLTAKPGEDISGEMEEGLDFSADVTDTVADESVESERADENDFISSIDISSLEETGEEAGGADDDALDFSLEDKQSEPVDQSISLSAPFVENSDDSSLVFESSLSLTSDEGMEGVESVIDAGSDDDELGLDAILGDFASGSAETDTAPEEGDSTAETSIDDAGETDDLGLDAILGEFEADDESNSGVNFESAALDVRSLRDKEEDDAVPETVIDSGSEEDELGLDAILGDFALKDSQDDGFPDSSDGLESDDDAVSETVIDEASGSDDLGLDDILGEFASYEDNGTGDSLGSETSQSTSGVTDIADMPEMDVSDELDDLLAEWGEGGADFSFETGPESLDVDRARSLLAEGSLDDAEAALTSALDGERRGDALIGLAEAAARRGDEARKRELLAEAETLLDDSNRAWFDSVHDLSV